MKKLSSHSYQMINLDIILLDFASAVTISLETFIYFVDGVCYERIQFEIKTGFAFRSFWIYHPKTAKTNPYYLNVTSTKSSSLTRKKNMTHHNLAENNIFRPVYLPPFPICFSFSYKIQNPAELNPFHFSKWISRFWETLVHLTDFYGLYPLITLPPDER